MATSKKRRGRKTRQIEEQILAEEWRTGFGKDLTRMRKALRKAWIHGPGSYVHLLAVCQEILRRERVSVMAMVAIVSPHFLSGNGPSTEPATESCNDPNCPIHGRRPEHTAEKPN